jgi:hypothetical protein
VPWILKYLAVGHEEVVLQLTTEVGVEKAAEAVKLWDLGGKEMNGVKMSMIFGVYNDDQIFEGFKD